MSPPRPEDDGALEVFSVSQDSKPVNEVKKKKSFFEIDKEMLRIKFHFFGVTGTPAITLPFMPVIATSSIGLSGSSLGSILTFQQISYVFINPMIGYITDYFNKVKVMINLLLFLFAILMTFLLFIPPIRTFEKSDLSHLNDCTYYEFNDKSHTVAKINSSIISEIEGLENRMNISNEEVNVTKITVAEFPCSYTPKKHTEIFLKLSPDTSCDQYESDSVISEKVLLINSSEYAFSVLNRTQAFNKLFCCRRGMKHYIISCENDTTSSIVANQFLTFQFWVAGACITIALISISAVLTLSDTACSEIVQKQRRDFGKQRLFCSLGFGSMIMTSGILYDITGTYIAIFILMWVAAFVTVFNLCFMDLIKPKFQKNIISHIGTVLISKEFLVFLFGVLVNGMGMSISRYYHILFLTRIGASRFLCGLVVGIQKLIEVPFMFFSRIAIKKLGYFHVLSLCILAYCLRYLCLSYLFNPWIAIPIELIQGVSGGLFFPAAIAYGKVKSKPGTEATTQAVVFATFDGLGMGLGSFLFGVGYDILGSHRVFFYSSLFFIAMAVVLECLTFLFVGKESSKQNSNEFTEEKNGQTTEDQTA